MAPEGRSQTPVGSISSVSRHVYTWLPYMGVGSAARGGMTVHWSGRGVVFDPSGGEGGKRQNFLLAAEGQGGRSIST